MAKARITSKTKKSAAKAKPAAKKSKRGAAKDDLKALKRMITVQTSDEGDDVSPKTDSYLSTPSTAEAANPFDTVERHSDAVFTGVWRHAGYAATAPLFNDHETSEVPEAFKEAWKKAAPVMLNLGGDVALEAAEAWLDLARTALGDAAASVFMKEFKRLVATQAREDAKALRDDERERKRLDKLPPMSPERTKAVRKMIQRHEADNAARQKIDVGAYLAEVEASYEAWAKVRAQAFHAEMVAEDSELREAAAEPPADSYLNQSASDPT